MATCAEIIAGSAAQFGTSGVRGLVEELDDATCFAYTSAFLTHLKTSQGLKPGMSVWVGIRPAWRLHVWQRLFMWDAARFSVALFQRPPWPTARCRTRRQR